MDKVNHIFCYFYSKCEEVKYNYGIIYLFRCLLC